MRGFGKAAPASRSGPVALTMVAGVAAGLLVASWVFAGSHHAALPSGSSGGSGIISSGGTAVPITTASTGAVAALQAEVTRLLQERDAAQRELAKLRAQVDSGSGSGAAGGAAGAAAGTCPDRHTPWAPSAERDKQYPELAEFLKKVRGLQPGGRRACAGGLGQAGRQAGRQAGGVRCWNMLWGDSATSNCSTHALPAIFLTFPRSPSTMRCWWRCQTRTMPGRGAC